MDRHHSIHTPKCRLDNWKLAQIRAMQFIKSIMQKYDIKYNIDAGDVNDFSRSYYSTEYINFMYDYCNKIHTIPGNHCLLDNAIENFDNSIISNLTRMGVLDIIPEEGWELNNTILYGYGYGCIPKHTKPLKTIQILIWHKYIKDIKSDLIPGYYWEDLLDEYPEYNIFITGDNHKHFIKRKGEQLLINGGSLFRLTADQIDYKPCIHILDTENYMKENGVISVSMPIKKDVISREHIDTKNNKIVSMEIYNKSLQEASHSSVNYTNNIQEFILLQEDIHRDMETLIMSFMPQGDK